MQKVQNNFSRHYISIIFLSFLITLSGCSQEHKDLHEYIKKVSQQPAKPIEPLPEFASYKPEPYKGDLVRDPFAPTVKSDERELVSNNGPRPDFKREKEQLEYFPLDGIRIVGVMEFSGTTYGLLRTNEPTIYRITVGNYIGQNHGKVAQIDKNGLIIRELIPDGNGGWQKRTQELTVETR